MNASPCGAKPMSGQMWGLGPPVRTSFSDCCPSGQSWDNNLRLTPCSCYDCQTAPTLVFLSFLPGQAPEDLGDEGASGRQEVTGKLEGLQHQPGLAVGRAGPGPTNIGGPVMDHCVHQAPPGLLLNCLSAQSSSMICICTCQCSKVRVYWKEPGSALPAPSTHGALFNVIGNFRQAAPS